MIVVVKLPTDGSIPSFRQRNTLDGVEFVLDFRWSQREEKWYLDIFDANGDPVLMCIKLVVAWPLLRSRRIAGVPAGDFYLVDGRADIADPGLTELGPVVSLCYIEEGTL